MQRNGYEWRIRLWSFAIESRQSFRHPGSLAATFLKNGNLHANPPC